MAQHHVVLHARAAQVEIAVPQARVLGDRPVVGDRERRGLRLVEQPDFARAISTSPVFSFGFTDSGERRSTAPITATTYSGRRRCTASTSAVVAGDDLRDAVAVADVDERERSEIAQAVHPSEQDDLAAGVFQSKLAARMGTGEVFERLNVHGSSSEACHGGRLADGWKFGPGDRLSAPGAHVLDGDDAARALVGAEDGDAASAAALAVLELLPELVRLRIYLDAHALGAAVLRPAAAPRLDPRLRTG